MPSLLDSDLYQQRLLLAPSSAAVPSEAALLAEQSQRDPLLCPESGLTLRYRGHAPSSAGAGPQPGASEQGAGAWGFSIPPSTRLAPFTFGSAKRLPGALTCRKAVGLGCEQRRVFAIECSFLIPRGAVGGGLFGGRRELQEPGRASKLSVGAPGKAVPAVLAGRDRATFQPSSSLFFPGARRDYHQRHCSHVRATGSLLSLRKKISGEAGCETSTPSSFGSQIPADSCDLSLTQLLLAAWKR